MNCTPTIGENPRRKKAEPNLSETAIGVRDAIGHSRGDADMDADADGWREVCGWSKWDGDLTARFRPTDCEMEVQVLFRGRVVCGAVEPTSPQEILEWMEEWGTFDRILRIHG